MTIWRRSTREIATTLEATERAHHEDAAASRARFERALTDHTVETARMHAEQSASIALLRASISKVHDRIDRWQSALLWKLIGWMGTLIALGLSVIGYLLVNGVRWK